MTNKNHSLRESERSRESEMEWEGERERERAAVGGASYWKTERKHTQRSTRFQSEPTSAPAAAAIDESSTPPIEQRLFEGWR